MRPKLLAAAMLAVLPCAAQVEIHVPFSTRVQAPGMSIITIGTPHYLGAFGIPMAPAKDDPLIMEVTVTDPDVRVVRCEVKYLDAAEERSREQLVVVSRPANGPAKATCGFRVPDLRTITTYRVEALVVKQAVVLE